MTPNLAQLPTYAGPYAGWPDADLGNAHDWTNVRWLAAHRTSDGTDRYWQILEAALGVAVDFSPAADEGVGDLLAVQHALIEAARIVGETILATLDRLDTP